MLRRHCGHKISGTFLRISGHRSGKPQDLITANLQITPDDQVIRMGMGLSQDPPVYRQRLSVGTVSCRVQAGSARIVEMKSRHLTTCSGRPVQTAIHFILLSKAFFFQRLGDQRIRTQFLRRVMVSVKQRHQLMLYRTGKLHILFLKISSDLHLKHLDQKHTAHDQRKNRHREKTHKKLTPERSLDKVLHDPPPFPAMSTAHLSKMDFWFFTAHPRSKSMIEPSSF